MIFLILLFYFEYNNFLLKKLGAIEAIICLAPGETIKVHLIHDRISGK